MLDYIVIVIYFAVMLGAAYWGFRRATTADDYLVAGPQARRSRCSSAR